MNDYINLCRDFISKRKSLLIAPAGCGKTYTIAECLKYTEGLHLILTHTHAGVASLKKKLKKKVLQLINTELKLLIVMLKNMLMLFTVKTMFLNKIVKIIFLSLLKKHLS